MSTLAERVDAAIRASGKKANQIAQALKVDETTISRLRTGKEDNPKLQLLIGIARETGTTIGVLVGASLELSREDENELQRFRGWIDRKLQVIDAVTEPNAEILPAKAGLTARDRRIADRPERAKSIFGTDADIALRAIGESMIGEGILPNDTLYAVAHEKGAAPPVGKLVACRIGEDVFVKKLISVKSRLLLQSAHPRYRSIALEGLTFEILGLIIGRQGRIG